MERALEMPDAHNSTLNPGGILILLSGIFSAGNGAGGCGTGARGESFRDSGCPCFQVGDGCWANSADVAPAPMMTAARSATVIGRPVKRGCGGHIVGLPG